jgi:hypothetical protein
MCLLPENTQVAGHAGWLTQYQSAEVQMASSAAKGPAVGTSGLAGEGAARISPPDGALVATRARLVGPLERSRVAAGQRPPPRSPEESDHFCDSTAWHKLALRIQAIPAFAQLAAYVPHR